MTINATVEGLVDLLAAEFQAAKVAGQAAMAEKFFEITRENFGNDGIDRPIEWPALSPKYAKRVGREHATLFVSGELEASLTWQSTPEYAEVFTDSEYAEVHQFGGGNHIPARPFMPLKNASAVEDAELTDFAAEQVIKAAENAINERLK
jgi:phage gpG-like protein